MVINVYITFSILILLMPYFLVLILLLSGNIKENKPIYCSDWPIISVIIPTFNEEKNITRKLEEILDLDYPREKLEIIVVDESTDDTVEIVKGFQKKYPNIIRLIHHNNRLGWAKSLNNGYNLAKGDILIKSDCDAKIFTNSALKLSVSYLYDPTIGGVTGVYSTRGHSDSNYRSLLHRLQIAESNLSSTIIAHGAFLAFKKNYYKKMDETILADDTAIFMDIIGQGYRTIVVPEIETEEKRPDNYFKRQAQRSRRAHGILKLIFSEKGKRILNTGYINSFILFLNVFLIAFSPIFLLIIFTLFYMLLINITVFGNIIYLSLILLIMLLWLPRKNAIFSFLDTQISGLIGIYKLIYERASARG